MNKTIEQIEPFAVGYLSASYDDIGYRVACGMREYAKRIPIYIRQDQFFAGSFEKDAAIGCRFTYGNGLTVSKEKFKKEMQENPQCAAELERLLSDMLPFCTFDKVIEQETPQEALFAERRVCWGGAHFGWFGHANPDFSSIVKNGTNGVRDKIYQYKRINPSRAIFYDSLLITLEALDIWANRHREQALLLSRSADGEDRERLLRMANALQHVPKNPARNLYEAFSAFWLVFCMDGIDSPGPFDQYMEEYYKEASENERRYCLDGIWRAFYQTRTWNLCIGGRDSAGRDLTNELTYDILKIAKKYRYNTPNLTMRVHKDTPQSLWYCAVDTLASGIGMPALYNDDCVCPSLQRFGISVEDSFEYCMNGCNQIDIFGKSHMGLEDGEVCLAKCLELALYNGVCGLVGDKISIETGAAQAFKCFDDIMAAYKAQVEHATDVAVSMANRTQEIASIYGANPLRSCLICGCIEKGLDYNAGGPIYGNAQILAEGIADAADSLAAIRHFVFDTGKYTMCELISALQADFVGYDALYRDFSGFYKFGNGIAYVDDIYKDILEHFYKYLLTKKAFRGGYYGGGCSPFNRAAIYASTIGALPNGKRRSSPILADSIGAVPGCDKNGPTALMESVLRADHLLAKSGNILQLKFLKTLFEAQSGRDAFIALAKTYFSRGGQQLTVNLLSRDELLDAQKHPELHEDLIVRVGGYSDYFVRLSQGLQENIIQRTELSCGTDS